MSFKFGKADSLRTVSLSTANFGLQGHVSKGERDMHGQIEDLLTALSEMQREHAQLAAMLQKEREERGEDHRAVRQLVSKLRKEDIEGEERHDVSSKEDRRRTLPALPFGGRLVLLAGGGHRHPRRVLTTSLSGPAR